MFAASSKGGGGCKALPDVCKTPGPTNPVPVAYPNTCAFSNASKTCTKVKIVNQEACNDGFQIDRSMGDEAGTLKGMQSQKNMGKCAPKKGSKKVKFQGKKAVFHTVPMAQNGTNANAPAGIHETPCQSKVRVAA